jgi:hypothetical protein
MGMSSLLQLPSHIADDCLHILRKQTGFTSKKTHDLMPRQRRICLPLFMLLTADNVVVVGCDTMYTCM